MIPMDKDKLPHPAREAFPRRDPRYFDPSSPVVGPSKNRIKLAAAARNGKNGGAKNAPDDIFFKSNKILVANRNSLPGKIIKKLARKPTKEFN